MTTVEIAYISLNETQLLATMVSNIDKGKIPVSVFMDDRTTNDQLEILDKVGVEYKKVHNSHGFVEGLHGVVANDIESEWVWILNGDEWPNDSLIDAVLKRLEFLPDDINCIGFARKWIARNLKGDVYYSRSLKMRNDYQWRIIRKDHVKFEPTIHTPGFNFDIDRALKISSQTYLCHFDWIAHSYSLRERKLEYYESLSPGASRQFRHWYLPEEQKQRHFMKKVDNIDIVRIANEIAAFKTDNGWVDGV
jgi:hypothetical protein